MKTRTWNKQISSLSIFFVFVIFLLFIHPAYASDDEESSEQDYLFQADHLEKEELSDIEDDFTEEDISLFEAPIQVKSSSEESDLDSDLLEESLEQPESSLEESESDISEDDAQRESADLSDDVRTIKQILTGMTIGSSEEAEPPLMAGGSADEQPDFNISDSIPTIGESFTIGTSGLNPPSLDDAKLKEDIAALRNGFDILLYGIFPIILSAFLLVKFCRWFYSTFIQSAFEHII